MGHDYLPLWHSHANFLLSQGCPSQRYVLHAPIEDP